LSFFFLQGKIVFVSSISSNEYIILFEACQKLKVKTSHKIQTLICRGILSPSTRPTSVGVFSFFII